MQTINQIESIVLSALFFEQERFDEIKGILSSKHFQTPLNQIFFETLENVNERNEKFEPEIICFEAMKVAKERKYYQNLTTDEMLNEISIITAQSPIVNIEPFVNIIINNYATQKTFEINSQTRNTINHNTFNVNDINAHLDETIQKLEKLKDETCLQNETKTVTEQEQWLKNNPPNNIKYQTGIDFLDTCLKGGIKLNQLALIAGNAESGKTSLGLQILHNMSKSHKVCYFSLEFPMNHYISRCNKVYKYLLQQQYITKELQQQMKENTYCNYNATNIKQLESTIHSLTKKGVKFFLIDSQMCINVDEEISSIEKQNKKFEVLNRLVQKHDIAIFFITQLSKNDKSSPYGSVIGQYIPSIIIHIHRKNKDEYTISIEKNKQEGILDDYEVNFDKNTLFFSRDNNPIKRNQFSNNYEYVKPNSMQHNYNNVKEIIDLDSVLLFADKNDE